MEWWPSHEENVNLHKPPYDLMTTQRSDFSHLTSSSPQTRHGCNPHKCPLRGIEFVTLVSLLLDSSKLIYNLMKDELSFDVDGIQGKHRVTKRGPALSNPMFTLVIGIVGRWRVLCQKLRDYLMKTLSRAAQYPDLDPVENLWNVIKRMTDSHKPSNKEELLTFLYQKQCERLVESMPRCMKAVINPLVTEPIWGSNRLPKLLLEEISFLHQYDSRLTPNEPIRGKRHGGFVWREIKTESGSAVPQGTGLFLNATGSHALNSYKQKEETQWKAA
ncbi:unnamed protein product [Ranitomeya imitator]|uniref:Uncharacterized protein n=1 Tax=Ranitomeya imitator TaxID=111125 RepID=A0ABN9LGA2_9NEOB|nr:unnamed protein product [Ranitomeya imitator]